MSETTEVERVVMCPLCGKPPFIGKMRGDDFPDTYECSDMTGECPLSLTLFSKQQWDKFKPFSQEFIECAQCGKVVPDTAV